MVQNKISNPQLLGQSAGIQSSAMMFFVRLEDVFILIKTESFRQQPVASFDISSVPFIVGFVSQADQRLKIGQYSTKAELFGLG